MSALSDRERELRIRGICGQLRGCRVPDQCPHCEKLIVELLALVQS